MSQRWIPAVFYRGGTSKGLFFHERDLPPAGPRRDSIFLSALGSPDPYGRQLDGMGGGVSSLSKIMTVRRSDRPDADVDYTFGQVDVPTAVVDYSANCGNLSAAVGPFAVDEGLVASQDGTATVRIHNTNTGQLLRAIFTVRDGLSEVEGSTSVPGVAGTGAPIELEYHDPAGTRTGRLLPTGHAVERIETPSGGYRASLIDAANPMVFVAAHTVGLDGTESPGTMEARPEVMRHLDEIRRAASAAMGLSTTASAAPLAAPKIATIAPPSSYTTLTGENITPAETDLVVRVVSMGQPHRALPATAALCCAAAYQIPATVLSEIAGHAAPDSVRLGSPSGVVTAGAKVELAAGQARVRSSSLFRTARPLMHGSVAVPEEPR